MKICLVGPYFGYRHSVVRSLERAAGVLGHKATVVDPESAIRNNQPWVHKVASVDYDLILCPTVNGLHKVLDPRNLPPRVLWLREEIRRPEIQSFLREACNFYSKVYYFDPGGKRVLDQLRIPVSFLPLCMDPRVHQRFDQLPRDLDVVFIGSLEPRNGQDWYTSRRIALEKIQSASLNLTIRSSWDPEENSRWYSRAKIAFNLGAYFQDYGPPEGLRSSGYQNRVFEGMASGALMFNHKVEEGRIFAPNRELVEYTGDDLVDLLRQYLADVSGAREIAEAGYRLVRKKHTYKNRLAEVLEDVGKTP